jgi:hypothetical protein
MIAGRQLSIGDAFGAKAPFSIQQYHEVVKWQVRAMTYVAENKRKYNLARAVIG